MAIFIVDQFSLNTDLPLDVRYVPNGGRLDPDISIYKYAGMQVYDVNDESIWYCDNNLNWVKVGSGTDASINNLYNIVNDLSTLVHAHDASITDLYQLTNNLESSILRIDSSLNANTALLQIHEASIGDLTARVTLLEGSVAYLTSWNEAQDASIEAIGLDISTLNYQQGVQDASIEAINLDISTLNYQQGVQDASIEGLRTDIGLHETSLGNLTSWNETQDSSIEGLRTRIDVVDGSITYITEWNEAQDASIIDLRDNIEASLGLYVLKAGDTMTGPLTITNGGLVVNNDVSIGNNLVVSNDADILGSVGIRGNLSVDGSVTFVNTIDLEVSTNFIHLNTGLTGQPPSWLQSGVIVERGDASSYAIIFDETDKTFRVGIVWNPDPSGTYMDSQTKPVAAREDNAVNKGIAFWQEHALNNGLFDTDSTFTYSVVDGLDLDSSLKLDAYAGVLDLMLVVGTDGYVKAIPTADASLQDIYNLINIIDSSITYLTDWNIVQDSSIVGIRTDVTVIDGSITYLTSWNEAQDASIADLRTDVDLHETSLGNLTSWNQEQDASIDKLFEIATDTSILGAINVGDGSAGVYAGITNDGSIRMRELTGVGAATVTENGDIIEIGIDASFGGEVNTASNIGTGEGVYAKKTGSDLEFKSIDTNTPSQLDITSDNSTLYIDLSIGSIAADASVSGLTDTSINDGELQTHQILEYDASQSKWKNSNEILWDSSLATTSDDLGGIPQGTDLTGLTLKEILYKILYEYQVPTITVDSIPASGTYEKGLVGSQFSTIDVSYYATNTNYPLAKLNNIQITKTGSGSIFDSSLGLVDSSAGVYTDTTGITNWGGTSRTINYNVYIWDDQTDQSQPAVFGQESFTFYYRQYWGVVNGNININQVDSDLITGLGNSRLAGETNLDATFDNSTGVFIKYLFAYPDTVAAPDNFGTLSEIIDQNGFDITDSFTSQNEDVSVGSNNVRYRFYLLNNKVDTSTFDITFKF